MLGRLKVGLDSVEREADEDGLHELQGRDLMQPLRLGGLVLRQKEV